MVSVSAAYVDDFTIVREFCVIRFFTIMHCSAKQGIGRPGRLLNSKSFNYTVSDLLKYARVE
jgi:hypothetical protein